jgi:hypothetical protein
LILVPVVYAIFVMDLKLVKWEQHEHPVQPEEEELPVMLETV